MTVISVPPATAAWRPSVASPLSGGSMATVAASWTASASTVVSVTPSAATPS